MANRLAHLVVSRPRTILLGALVIALAALPWGLRLRLATNLVDLVPRSAPGTAAFARYSQAFSAEQSLVILVESRDPARLLEFAARYATELRRLPGVTRVRERIGPGAATLLRDHLLTFLDDEDLATLATRTTPDALRTQARRLRSFIAAPGGAALAPLLVADPLELLPLVSRRLQAGLPVDTTSGYFRSADGQALLLFVQAQHSTFDIEANRTLLAQAAEAARRTGGQLGDVSTLAADNATTPEPAPSEPTVWFTGAYAYAVEYRDWLHHDLQLSTLISAVTVLLSFALLLGAVRVLPLVALPLGLGLWLTAAAAAALFGQLSAVSLAFGTILLSIGIDVPIQLYNRLREELARLPTDMPAGEAPGAAARATARASEAAVHGAVEHTVTRLAGPSLIATLGPAAVFACCGLSRYRGLAELGTLAGLGLLLNLLVMVTVLPALLVWLPARWWLPARRPPTEGKSFAWLGRHAARHPRAVLLVTGLAALAAAPAALRLRYQEHLISVEPAGIHAARVTREVERRMGQRRSVLIALVEQQDREQALVQSDRWRVAAEQLRKRGLLLSYQSISNLFPSAAEQERRRTALERLGPRRIAADLRAALGEAGFDTAAFEPFLRQLETPPRPLTLADAGSDLQFLVAHHVQDLPAARLVATYLFPAAEHLDEAQAALAAVAEAQGGQVTGFPVLEKTLHELLRPDLLRVTLASVAAVALLLALYYREVRPVLAVLVPLSLAWVLFAALIGLLRIPLNLFNLLTVPLVVGYGIDDHIFLVQRHRELGSGPAEALGSTGRAIVVTSLSTMAGFAGLVVARFDGLRVLGSSGALAVALCLLAALAMLPALLALLFPTQTSRTQAG
ncbi:MAG TPA: MMPL family transporter [Polyangia bacterium]|nr:MMPL family transporter [Polyangia bacterium]